MLASTWHIILFFKLTVFIEYAVLFNDEMTSSEKYEFFTQKLYSVKLLGAAAAGSVASPKLVPCPKHQWGGSRGICLMSHACPWSKVLLDDGGACARYHSSYVCCEVQRKLMPTDMFSMFE